MYVILRSTSESEWVTRLNFMLHAVEVLVEDVDVERLELGLEHVVVVADADGAEGVEGVLLHEHVVVDHEVERRLEHLVHGVAAVLKSEMKSRHHRPLNCDVCEG